MALNSPTSPLSPLNQGPSVLSADMQVVAVLMVADAFHLNLLIRAAITILAPGEWLAALRRLT
jgi:hypothetical protein